MQYTICKGLMELAKTNLIERPNLSKVASNTIKEKIFTGELNPGSKINEDDLAKEFGISRTPVKIALTELNKEGLVELVPRRGAFVCKFSISDLIEIYEIREVLEGLAARLAAHSISKRELATLASLNNDYKTTLAKWKGIREPDALSFYRKTRKIDMEFHKVILKASCNKRLMESSGIRVIEYQSFLFIDYLFFDHKLQVGDLLRTVEEHCQIIALLREKDGKKAEKLSRTHIRRVINSLKDKLPTSKKSRELR